MGTFEVPSHYGTVWLDVDAITLTFPEVRLTIQNKQPLHIDSHEIRFRPDENGMKAVEAFLYVRREMMQGNEQLAFRFADQGADLIRIYKDFLGW
jgi:hypothetical protein